MIINKENHEKTLKTNKEYKKAFNSVFNKFVKEEGFYFKGFNSLKQAKETFKQKKPEVYEKIALESLDFFLYDQSLKDKYAQKNI